MLLSWEDTSLTGKGKSSRRTGHTLEIRSSAHATAGIRVPSPGIQPPVNQ